VDFDELKRSWQQLGSSDPRWAILSEPGREGGGWDDAAFWHSGEQFVHWVAQHLDGLGVLPARGRALDFGCGHGRLTQALAAHFEAVTGVDIASSMLDAARTANRYGERVQYVHNETPDLRVFADASFDFVLSVLVLQHMRPDYAAGYLREFLRVLVPGGTAFFQIPLEPLAPAATDGAPDAVATTVPVTTLRARSSLLPPQVALAAGDWQWFRVELQNAGEHLLPAGATALGVRFVRADGSVASRVTWQPLPHDLPAGAAVSWLVPARAPATAGAYALQALPGQGGAFCAAAHNVAATSLVLVSERPPGRAEQPSPPPMPRPQPSIEADAHGIEVHGTPLASVLAVIEAAGGAVVDVSPDVWAGPQWLSAHITVRKR
jgi:SAM-dependent methyltransferase